MLSASISSGTTEPRRRGSRLPVGGRCGTAAADLHHRRILSERHHARTPSCARDRWARHISIHQRHKEPFLSSFEDSRAMYDQIFSLCPCTVRERLSMPSAFYAITTFPNADLSEGSL